MSQDMSATPRTGSETPPSVVSASNVSSSITNTATAVPFKASINDLDHPPDRTLWLGDLEPWMDDHYMVQVCSLFGWPTSAIHIPRPPAAPNATRHPNNAGYCLLIFPDQPKARAVLEQYGQDAQSNSPNGQPILLPNSNHPIKLDWLNSNTARTAMGQEPGPIDNAIEYSIFVGDIAADVTNADLMNVFRNPNLGLRGDFPPRLIAPFLSCCNAKVMVDSVTGISKGYGFVRFTSETDQKRALLEMQGLYCKSRPMRLSTATAKNKSANPDEEHTEHMPVVVRVTPNLQGSASSSSNASPSSSTGTHNTAPSGPIPPSAIDPNRIRSITAAVADQAASKPHANKTEFSSVMLAKIAQLSNTMGQHYPAYRAGVNGPVLPPSGMNMAQIQQWLIANPQARGQLETILGNGNESTQSDPLNTTVFVGGLSPLISEDTLRTFFAPFGAIHYVKVPPGKSCGFVQFVRKSDAERAIEALSGFSIGGSKVRLSWGRIPAAQQGAQAAAAAAAAANASQMQHSHSHHNRSAPSAGSGMGSGSDGPLSSEQALHIVEKLVPALMAAAGNGAGPGYGASANPAPGGRGLSQNQMHPRPPMPGYRDPFAYNNNVGAIPQGPAAPYMHGGMGHGHGHGHGGSPYGPHGGGRVDYGRNDYYYDVPPPAATANAYGSNMPYGGGMNMNMGHGGMNMNTMSPAMGGMGLGVGAASASVLEDQLLGTYGGGINRLQTNSLRHGPGSAYGSVGTPTSQYGPGYGSNSSSGYGGGNANVGGGGAYMGGLSHGAFDYDDLGAYRSPSGNANYSAFGAFGNNADLADRFTGRGAAGSGGAFSPTRDGGMNGFGMNGLTPQGSASGSGGGTSPSRYDYTDDPIGSPQFQASDILRQDAGGLSGYNGTGGGKPNGHSHSGGRGGTTGGLGVKDGMHDITGMFGNLAVGGQGGGQKTPISPSSATGTGSGTSFGTQHGHQHFRGDSGRFN